MLYALLFAVIWKELLCSLNCNSVFSVAVVSCLSQDEAFSAFVTSATMYKDVAKFVLVGHHPHRSVFEWSQTIPFRQELMPTFTQYIHFFLQTRFSLFLVAGVPLIFSSLQVVLHGDGTTLTGYKPDMEEQLKVKEFSRIGVLAPVFATHHLASLLRVNYGRSPCSPVFDPVSLLFLLLGIFSLCICLLVLFCFFRHFRKITFWNLLCSRF